MMNQQQNTIRIIEKFLETEIYPAWNGSHKILPSEFIRSTNRTESKILVLSSEGCICKSGIDALMKKMIGKLLSWGDIESLFDQIDEANWMEMVLVYPDSRSAEFVQLFDSGSWNVTKLYDKKQQ